MIKTRFTALALAAATALTPLAAQAAEIEWLQWFAAENTDGFYDELVADFEAKHPDITVKLVTQPFGKVRESIVTDNAIGVGSDVLGLNMPWTKEFLDIGILEPLDEYLARDDNSFATSDLVEAPLGKIDGHTWMVPLNAFPFVMHVNMGLVRQAGFDAPPATWEELAEQAGAISALEDGISGIGMPFSSQPPSNGPILTFLPLLYAHGGRIMADTTPNFDNPEVVATLQFLKDMNDAGAIAPGAASRTGGVDLEEFIAGRTIPARSPAAIPSWSTRWCGCPRTGRPPIACMVGKSALPPTAPTRTRPGPSSTTCFRPRSMPVPPRPPMRCPAISPRLMRCARARMRRCSNRWKSCRAIPRSRRCASRPRRRPAGRS